MSKKARSPRIDEVDSYGTDRDHMRSTQRSMLDDQRGSPTPMNVRLKEKKTSSRVPGKKDKDSLARRLTNAKLKIEIQKNL